MCPIFEYSCDGCTQTFELIQKADDHDRATCPNCLWEAKRIISSGGFNLKGEGFYSPTRQAYQPE